MRYLNCNSDHGGTAFELRRRLPCLLSSGRNAGQFEVRLTQAKAAYERRCGESRESKRLILNPHQRGPTDGLRHRHRYVARWATCDCGIIDPIQYRSLVVHRARSDGLDG